MKKSIILIQLFFLFFASSGQKITVPGNDTTMTVKNYEIQHIRECLQRYQNERLLAYSVTGIGIAAILINAKMTDDSKGYKYGNIIGGAIIGIGGLIFIDSEKWLRRAAIKPIPGGIAIRIGNK